MQVAVGIRVERLGTSSVTYRFSLFAKSKDSIAKRGMYLTQEEGEGGRRGERGGGEEWVGDLCATGRFVHVFVALPQETPTKIDGPLRDALMRLM
jgi:acyl-CoA thioesterase FadM